MKKSFSYILVISIIIFNIACNSKSEKRKVNLVITENQIGKVVGIIDGDTYDILLEKNKLVRVRMEGIDAPEKGMPFYRSAKKHLSDLCFGKQVTLRNIGTDNRGRTLAFSYLKDETELSREMLKAGLAWHFKKYNSDADLAKLETEARIKKIGIWTDENPMPPWTNRVLHRNGVSTIDSFDIKEGEQ